jgi:hypothetical protein
MHCKIQRDTESTKAVARSSSPLQSDVTTGRNKKAKTKARSRGGYLTARLQQAAGSCPCDPLLLYYHRACRTPTPTPTTPPLPPRADASLLTYLRLTSYHMLPSHAPFPLEIFPIYECRYMPNFPSTLWPANLSRLSQQDPFRKPASALQPCSLTIRALRTCRPCVMVNDAGHVGQKTKY